MTQPRVDATPDANFALPLAELVQRTDWAATPIGPMDEWPQSLRTALSICLQSRFPILLWWGPQLVMLYNDAYSAILGAKHPRALGQAGAECWPEIWEIIGPMLAGVLDRGAATWSEDQLLLLERNGFPEECYFTFSYSPIREEGDRIGGVFTAVTETTAHVVAERRVRTLRSLATATSDAARAEDACARAAVALAENAIDLPFALLYLLTPAGDAAVLAGSSGMVEGAPAAPPRIALDVEGASSADWPLRVALDSGGQTVVADARERFAGLPSEPWDEPPHTAAIVRLEQAGQEQPAGFLIAGVSPHRPLDDDFRGFLDLAASQIATAITDARVREAEHQRAEALAELDRAKTAFFNNTSHEFRTPLTLMLGPLDDLLSRPDGAFDPETSETLRVVQRNGLRLLKLVNTLLDFARIEAGRVEASYEPVDLAALTADLASSFRAAVEHGGLRLIVDCPPLPEPVYVDRDMWEKIVLNLLSNAFKFTLEGEIAVRLRWEGEHVVLSVTDTGIGIPADELPRLFERFHRVRDTRARTLEGTGIGLALVQELVRLHGGTVTAASVLGEGTTISVAVPTGTQHLPADRLQAALTRASTAIGAAAYVEEALRWLPDAAGDPAPVLDAALDTPPATLPQLADASPARVLIADDNADMRDYLARLLGTAYTVETVADGGAALAAVRERPPDLLLSDVMMPGIDGLALVRALRADPATRRLPVLLLSARAGEEARIEGIDAGADDYLVKPFSARELLARVAGQIALARVRVEAMQRERQLRREAEEARQHLFDLLMQAPAFVCVLEGPQHRFVFINRRYRQLLGPRDLIGLNVRDAAPEIVGQGYLELLDTVYRTGEPFVGDATLLKLDRRGNGELEDIYITFVYQPIRDEDGAVSGIFVHGFEVTDQVRAREASERGERTQRFLAEASMALAGSLEGGSTLQQLARLCVPALADFCFFDLLQDDGQVVRSAGAQADEDETAVRRYDRRSAPAGSAVARVLDSGQSVLVSNVTDAFVAGVAQSPEHLAALRARRVISVLAVPLVARGRLIGVLTLYHTEASGRHFSETDLPVAEELALRAALAVDNARLYRMTQEALQVRDTFLAAVTHDLRTPLATITGMAQLIERQLRRDSTIESDRVQPRVAEIERSAERMAHMVDDLLDVTRLEMGSLPALTRSDTDLVALARHVVANQQRLAPAHLLRVTTNEIAIWGRWDASRLERVIANLLNNAVKYSPDGGTVTVEVRYATDDPMGAAEIVVADSGIGIPEADLPHVFERFRRGGNVGAQIKGTGIGLATVQQIVAQHGGTVALTSSEDAGTRVTVRLPLALPA
jgi:signal transduction histidine kinase/CheY-like chemotaxis protein